MKTLTNKFIVWAVFAWLLPFVANSQTPLTNGLVAYYPFSWNANDASGNGNNGIVSDAVPTFDRFGHLNRAFQFNGTDSYIVTADSSSLALTNAATFTAWVYLDASDGRRYILKKGQYLVDAAYQLRGDATSVEVAIELAGTQISCLVTNASLTVGAWTHVAGVFDGQTLSTYVNGQLRGSVAAVGQIEVNSYPVYIGADYLSPGGYFAGRIDDVRIYNRALTPEEITTLGGGPHLFKATFRASCRTTNDLGVLVSRPIANRDLIRDCAQEHGITNIASLALVYDVYADEVQVVQVSDGSRVCRVVFFQDSVSVWSADGTRRERQAFLFTEDNDQAIGSAVGTEQEVLDANGNLKKFKFSGDLQFGLSATETKGARVCKGTFSTGAKFVPKNPAP